MKKISTFLWVLMALLALPQAAGAQTFDTEADNIAAFLAAEDGKTVKLTLTDARVNAYADLAGCYYVEDATGAVAVKGIGLTKGTKLNGYFIGVKSTEDVDKMNDPSQGLEYQITVDGTNSSYTSAATELTGTEMTITEACQQASYGKLVTLSNVEITALGNGMNKQLADANGNTIRARDLFGVLPSGYTWPAKASTITGVVLYYYTGWFLIPISEEAIVEAPAEFDFHNNNVGLTPGVNGDDMNLGNLENVTLTKGNVSLTFVSGATMPTRFYDNGTRGMQLQLAVKGAQMRVTAAEGKAVTSIRFVYNLGKNSATGADVYNTSWNVDKGAGTFSTDKKNWTGNAKSVRFVATGAVYVDSIIVETADATTETVIPEADAYSTEAATLAAFNNLADGTLVKLTLKDAVITSGMRNEWGYYVQDETAGAHFYCTGLTFNVNDVLNGYVYVKKSNQTMGARIAMTEDTNKENITVSSGSYEPIESTKVADVNKAENKLKVVKLTGVAVKGKSATAGTITDSENTTIGVATATLMNSYQSDQYQDDLASVDYAKATVVGILFGGASANTISLISITDETATAITDIKAAEDAGNVVIYNLQGVRLNKLQKGINIVNGKKIVIK